MPRPMHRPHRLLRFGCWIAVLAAYVAAILPQREAPHLGGSDKLDHVAAFLTIALLARLAYPHQAAMRLFVLIALFGGAIELSQAVPFIGRDAQWSDWLADLIATGAGLVAGALVLRIAGRRD